MHAVMATDMKDAEVVAIIVGLPVRATILTGISTFLTFTPAANVTNLYWFIFSEDS